MKAKNLFKKSLALVLTLALLVLSVPMSIFMASAEEVSVPTPDSTDIGSYVNFYDNVATFEEYDKTGTLTTNSKYYNIWGANYAENGTYFASVKMTFDEYFEWAWVKNEETGKWERGAGSAGIVWGQTGFTIGTFLNSSDKRVDLSLVYRRGQKGFFVMDPAGNPVVSSGISGVGQCDVVELTAKYDSVNKSVTVWFNGDNGRVIKTSTIDLSGVNGFEFNGFDLRCGGGGSHPEDINDITNENKVANNVVFSDLHLWGDVSTTKHYMAPSIGDNKNLADDLTLSNAALNADWKDDGSFTWNYTDVAFEGIDWSHGAGNIIYASVTMANVNAAKGGGWNDTYGVYCGAYGDNRAAHFVRPQYNQQGAAGFGEATLDATDGWGAAGGDATFAHHANDQVFIFKFDVDANTVEAWRRTSVYNSISVYEAAYQDIYVGKWVLGTTFPALGLYINPSADLATFAANVTVKDVKVWTNGATKSQTANLTLSDPTLDAEYQATGRVTLDSNTDVVYLNGVETTIGIGQKVYYSFSTKYSAASNTVVPAAGAVNPIAVFATNTAGTDFAGYGPKPTYQHNGEKGLSGVTFSNKVLSTTGQFSGGTSVANYTIVYDVDTATAELWMISKRASFTAEYKKLADVSLAAGAKFAPGLSGRNVTAGTVTVSNISVSVTAEAENVTENVVESATAVEGGLLGPGLDNKEASDTIGVSNEVVWSVGTNVNNTGVYTSLKQNGYYDKITVVWQGLKGDLSKGSVVYSADFTIYNNAAHYNGANWGLIVATVDGHYIHTGFGAHAPTGSAYNNVTVVDGANVGEQAPNITSFLGASCKGSYSVAGTEEGVVVNVTAVLTGTTLTTYINGAKAQTFDFTGKTVVPQFGIAWGSGNAKDTISNVKIYGAGVEACKHSYTDCDDTTCDNCGAIRVAPGHTYDNAEDAVCNVCNSTRYIVNLLFKNGNLATKFADHVAGATAPENFTLAPGQFATQSLVLGGAHLDVNKGYTLEADFTVKTNSSMESHFGITAITIDGTQYTFGMLSNGRWNVPDLGNVPTQEYSLYIRKGNNNTLIGVSGTKITANDEGVTITLKVVVSAAKASFYANGTLVYDIIVEEGKVAAPFAAFTSRGANVTVSNVKVSGATSCVDHVYDNACDANCNLCGAGREVEPHTPDREAATCTDPVKCTICGAVLAKAHGHKYTDDFDTECDNGCGTTRPAPALGLQGYTDEKGNQVTVTVDPETREVYVTVIPAEGYVLKAGSLKLGDKNIINGVNTPADAPNGVLGDGVTFVIAYNGGAVSAQFVEKSQASFSTAVLGTQLHRRDDSTIDGIRFLNRFYIDGLTRSTLQTADAMTVTLNGETYTITDYGILGQAANAGTELTVEAYKWKASGIKNCIFSYTDNYIDISATIKANYPTDAFYAKQYELKGYVVLSNGEVIYSESFVACINDYIG